jgi:hypothetical protein
MLAGLSRLIDRATIRAAAARMPRADGSDPHLAEAQRLIESAEFIPEEVEAAKVQFDRGNQFHFETPRPGPFAENNVVHGRLYRCAEPWQQHPTVLLLHGWNDIIGHRIRFPLMAGLLNRHRFNAATLVMPYHFQRRPQEIGARGNFLCPDILRTVEAARQAISEIRAFAEWVHQQGCPAIGVMGISMGAWLTGLIASRDTRFACAVLLVPVARMDRLIQEIAFCESIREALKGQPVNAPQLNLTQIRPVMPKENILLIEGLYDLFMPPETLEELWQAWDKPDIWRMPYGHISILAAPGMYGRIIHWMEPRLRAPASK